MVAIAVSIPLVSGETDEEIGNLYISEHTQGEYVHAAEEDVDSECYLIYDFQLAIGSLTEKSVTFYKHTILENATEGYKSDLNHGHDHHNQKCYEPANIMLTNAIIGPGAVVVVLRDAHLANIAMV